MPNKRIRKKLKDCGYKPETVDKIIDFYESKGIVRITEKASGNPARCLVPLMVKNGRSNNH